MKRTRSETPEPRVTPTPPSSPDEPVVPPPSRRARVQFAFTATSPRYVITVTDESTRPGVFEFYSSMRMPEIGNKTASFIEGFITPADGLYINYFVRPHLGTDHGMFTASDRETLNAAGRTDKHGSTHLCELLKRLLANGKLQMGTAVRLHPAATVRQAAIPGQPANNSDEAQRQLVAYYERLSFRLDDYGDDRLETTVGEILQKCDDPVNPMQRVRFT